MKNFILFLAVLLTIPMSCKRTTDEPKKETVRQDSVASADTVVPADTTSALPPKVADELFDDFIYSFMKSKRFQLSRFLSILTKNPVSSRLGSGSLTRSSPNRKPTPSSIIPKRR